MLSLHIGGGFAVIQRPEEAPIDHLMVLACQISAITAQDLLFGPTLRRFPDLKVALSEGGIGWIPFYFDRIDRHFKNQEWLHSDFGGSCPLRCSKITSWPAISRIPRGSNCADRIGIHGIAWVVRLPTYRYHVAGVSGIRLERIPGGRMHREEIHQITWENACQFLRLGSIRTHVEGRSNRGSLAIPCMGC